MQAFSCGNVDKSFEESREELPHPTIKPPARDEFDYSDTDTTESSPPARPAATGDADRVRNYHRNNTLPLISQAPDVDAKADYQQTPVRRNVHVITSKALRNVDDEFDSPE